MIRFLPDTWWEMLLRPLAMAAPDAGVYIEIMAPDFRFVFALGLLALLLLLVIARHRTGGEPARAPLVLTAALAAAFVPWFATTANGRYFIAGLLVVGVVCVALVWLLPLTRGARLASALVLVALQAFAVQQASPWQAWSLAPWNDAPYFQVDIPPDMLAEPATYVTMSNITYSLIAPQFPRDARWMSLAQAPAADAKSPDSRRAQEFLAAAQRGRLVVLMPIVPGTVGADGLPNDEVSRIINEQLGAHRLSFTQPQACRLLRSKGIVRMALRKEAQFDEDKTRQFGFWACQLTYGGTSADAPAPVAQPLRYDAVFRAIENSCPRFFTPGEGSRAIPGGEVRNYSQAEMKAYVLDNGSVLYKYYRAFNPVMIGSIADVLSGKAKVDCGHIRGRSGMPWDREI